MTDQDANLAELQPSEHIDLLPRTDLPRRHIEILPKTARRVNVYLPIRLAERLLQVKDHVNVSAVCAEALEPVVAAEERKLGGGERRARVVNRLMAVEEQRIRAGREGFAAGMAWAEDAATWAELKHVATSPRIVRLDQIVRGEQPGPTPLAELRTAAGFVAGLGVPQPPPHVYIPVSAPETPEERDENAALWWEGFRQGVRDVYALVRDVMEPPPPAEEPEAPAG